LTAYASQTTYAFSATQSIITKLNCIFKNVQNIESIVNKEVSLLFNKEGFQHKSFVNKCKQSLDLKTI